MKLPALGYALWRAEAFPTAHPVDVSEKYTSNSVTAPCVSCGVHVTPPLLVRSTWPCGPLEKSE